MRVLVFTPTYGDGPRQETIDSVAAQAFAGEYTHEVSWHNPFAGGDMRNVLAQYVRGRKLAIKGNYDAMLTVEHDMQIPPDALQLLWDTGADVAYGVYMLRHGAAVLNAWEYLPGSINIGESLSIKRRALAAALQAQVVRVSGVGFGCTLIRRAVLDAIPFRAGASDGDAPDIPFAQDCLRAGHRAVAHFGVSCGHWDGQRWLEVGTSPATADIISNQRVNVLVDGEVYRLECGQRYSLPDGPEIADLQRAGYVTRM